MPKKFKNKGRIVNNILKKNYQIHYEQLDKDSN